MDGLTDRQRDRQYVSYLTQQFDCQVWSNRPAWLYA